MQERNLIDGPNSVKHDSSDEKQNDSTINLPLILGLTIPLAIIFVATIIIGAVFYFRKNASQAALVQHTENPMAHPSVSAAPEDQIEVVAPHTANQGIPNPEDLDAHSV